MPVRHRGFRAKNGGLSPYMLWLLCGVALGYNLCQDERQKRMYLIKAREKQAFVHATAVNALVGKGLLKISADAKTFTLSPNGFGFAHDRLTKVGLKPKSPIKDKVEDLVCAYTNDGADPSTYIG
jgi:hypothetical protein